MLKPEERDEGVASLHRYYHCSVEMKYRFAEVWGGPLPTDPAAVYTNPQILQHVYGYMYMSLWLAFLNSVVEGWQKIPLSDPVIDKLLGSTHLKSLKVFRHTVFHYQENYWAKMAEKHLSREGFLEWAVSLDGEFERWFGENGPTPERGTQPAI